MSKKPGEPRLMRPMQCLLLTGAVFSACPAVVMAQDSKDELQLQEIVVTARKREESLQRVPVAVSVIDQSVLENNISDSLTKIGELAPQVSLSQGGSGTGAVITIRGVSSASNDAGLDQSVAIEVDGVPISRGQIISASMYDLEQVQVLQGPQALFFGKNSPAVDLPQIGRSDRYLRGLRDSRLRNRGRGADSRGCGFRPAHRHTQSASGISRQLDGWLDKKRGAAANRYYQSPGDRPRRSTWRRAAK
jgi:outer membrane receptor protein involved in Fe transport